jgi:hypothetical protein
MSQAAVSTIAHQIELSIAPVFLLAGIGALLSVLTQRLARAVERGRNLERDFAELDETGRRCALVEMHLLDRRIAVVNLAITACTAAALFVCVLIAMMFIASLADFAFGRPIAWLFIITMFLLIAGLLFFLWEIRLAIRALQVGRDQMPHRRPLPRK